MQLSGAFSSNLYASIASDGTDYVVAWTAWTSTGPRRINATRLTSAGDVTLRLLDEIKAQNREP